MRKGLLLLILLLAYGIAPVSAQEDASPLLRMLARIPDGIEAREWLTYIDYPALFSARPGAPNIGSWAEFEALMGSESDEEGAFMSALLSIQSGPNTMLRSFMELGAMPDLMGFDWFEIEQAAEYGQPPGTVTILEGDFDTDAIRAAHEARDYTQTEAGDLTLLCPPAGCDSGAQQNLRERNLANPFGGELGRSQPVLLGDGVVASSTIDQSLNAVAEAISDERDSLADDPDYRAAAEALSASGTVLQSYFISPVEFFSVSSSVMNPRMSQEQMEAIMERLREDFVPMPQYNLVAIAHTVTEDEQQAQVALVYTNAEAAEAAAEMFPARLETYQSLVVNRPFMEILTDRGVTSIDTTIHESSSERVTLLITLHAPLPSTEPLEGEDRLQSLGLPFAALVQAFIQRDLGWLATAL